MHWPSLIALCLSLPAAADVPAPAAREEATMPRLEGEWKVVAAQYCGRKVEGFVDAVVTVRGGRGRLRAGDAAAEWDYRLGPAWGTVDVGLSLDGERLTALGAYTLEKEALTVSFFVAIGPCGIIPSKARPRPTGETETHGLLVLTLRRQRP
jgi:hypothetical protein